MILGQVRRRFPRVVLALPGREGPFEVELIVDTAFDGDLALPPDLPCRRIWPAAWSPSRRGTGADPWPTGRCSSAPPSRSCWTGVTRSGSRKC